MGRALPLSSCGCCLLTWINILIEEGLDTVVRLGNSRDSQLIMHRLATARLIVCAAPDYLRRYGEPKILSDLQYHQCLNFVMPQTGFCFNHPEALVETAIAGGGLIQLYNFLVRPAIAHAYLKPVLGAFAPLGSPIAILYPQKRYIFAKLRVFIEFMDELTVQLQQQEIAE